MKKSCIMLAAAMAASLCAPMASAVSALPADAAEDAPPVVGYWSTEPGITERPVAAGKTETYAEEDRMWQGLPTIAVTPGGRIWCAWQTGDSVEGSQGIDNYDVMYYSDDDGKTWSSEYMIWDVPDDNIRLTSPCLFYDQFGKLWLILIRGGLNGVYAMEMKNPDCENPSENLEMGEPIDWMKFPPSHRVTILSNGYWITPVEVNVREQVTYVCNPDNEAGKYAWKQNTTQPAVTQFPDNKTFGESQIIELQDGRLMMLSRLPKDCGGGMEISYSSDFGTTWAPYKADNGVPYISPSSKFFIQRLESGAILLVTHATTSDRKQLAAYLSYDDGKTWPYMLMLDDTEIRYSWQNYGVSYPEVAAQQGEHGEIYIAYDAGRYELKEIRMCVITEEDIKAGRPVTEYCRMREQISRLGGYMNYIDTKEDYERYYTVEPGTEKSAIVEQLPTTVTLIGEDGSELELTGEWECLDYSKNVEGFYTFAFSKQVTSGKAQDLYSLLKVYVTVAEPSDPDQPSEPSDPGDEQPLPIEGGCGGGCGATAVGFGAGGAAAVLTGTAAVFLLRKKTSAKRK